MKFNKLLIIFAFILSLMACNLTNDNYNKNLDNLTTAEKWQYRQKILQNIHHYQANGSLIFRTAHTQYYSRFFFKQTAPNYYQLRLTSPIGSPIFSLIVTPQQSTLIDNEGKRYTHSNIEELIHQLTGFNTPVKLIHYWIKGLSYHSDKDKINEQGQLVKSTLQQDNQLWSLAIERYTMVDFNHKSFDLPATIKLTKKEEELTLKINQWKID